MSFVSGLILLMSSAGFGGVNAAKGIARLVIIVGCIKEGSRSNGSQIFYVRNLQHKSMLYACYVLNMQHKSIYCLFIVGAVFCCIWYFVLAIEFIYTRLVNAFSVF